MASTTENNVSYRLLSKLSSLVICSRCLQRGVVTPVPQVISERHTLVNECDDCRTETPDRQKSRRRIAKLVTPRR